MVTASAASSQNTLSTQPLNQAKMSGSLATPQKVNACVSLVETVLDDMKAKDILSMNIENVTDIADRVVIACGKSTRHVRSLASHVAAEAKKAGYSVIGVEGEQDAEWILVDLSSVVVHVMLPAARAFYDLESLWHDPANTKEADAGLLAV